MSKEYYLSITSGQKKGFISELVRLLLSSFAVLYFVVLQMRSAAYKYGVARSHRLPVKVISIGNITTGGTGKTPLVELVVRTLSCKRCKIAILSRGYGARTKPAQGNCSKSSEDTAVWDQTGFNDECLVLDENLDNVPIFPGSNRFLNGQKAIMNYGVEFLVLDDGFQHFKLKRDLDIVVIDAFNPFAGERLIPGGALREPLKCLERADLFVLSHCNQIPVEGLRAIYSRLRDLNSTVPICESAHEPVHVENLADNLRVKTSWLQGKRVYGFCAIGNPQSFESTIRELCAEVIQFRTFPDHHAYTQAELDNIVSEAGSLNVDVILVTQKDAVKIKNLIIHDVIIMSVVIELKITKGAMVLEDALLNMLNQDKK